MLSKDKENKKKITFFGRNSEISKFLQEAYNKENATGSNC